MPESSDLELLGQWQRGDEHAGVALFERYFPAICRFFANKCAHELDDLVQATFLRLLNGRDRIADPSRFRGYLFGIAHNVLREHLREARPAVSVDDICLSDPAAGASSLLRGRVEHRVLLQGLRSIPLTQQVVLELFYWEGMTGEEIAEALDCPLGTVRTRLRDGRLRLQQVCEALVAGERLSSTTTDLDSWATGVRVQLDLVTKGMSGRRGLARK